MDKLLTIPQYDRNGDPNTRLLPSMHPSVFEKTAGVLPDEVQEYLAKFKPDPNFLYLLIVALGAADYWGSNVNGDAFFEDDLLGLQSPGEAAKNPGPYANKQMSRYKTFSFAKIRKYHQNKEHHPDYGHVELPVYDDKMKRVLLIVAVDRKKAPDIIAEAEANRPIVWSMGCFTEDAKVQMGDGSRRRISLVEPGEGVLTHTGSIGKIKNTQKKWHDGDMYTIEMFGVEKPLIVTPEHPFYASELDRMCRCGCGEKLVRNIKDKSSFSITRGSLFKRGHHNKLRGNSDVCIKDHYPPLSLVPDTFSFVEAKELSEGDFLITPAKKEYHGEVDDFITPGLARLFGYFLAEGSYLKHNEKHNSVVFSFGNHEDYYIDEVVRLVRQELNVEPCVYEDCGQSKTCTEVRVNDANYSAPLFYKYCGEYSDKKAIHASVMDWPRRLQLELIGAYLNGDASIKRGVIVASTVSKTLAEQIHFMSNNCGVAMTLSEERPCQNKKVSTDGVAKKKYYENTIRSEFTNKLLEFCDVFAYERKAGKGTKHIGEYGDHVYRQIKKITKHHYAGYVYNFEVEGDNSYVVNDVAVHNCKLAGDVCSICRRMSKSVKNYCDHLKYQMNQTLPSGDKVYAINPTPRFFDISKVAIPADRTAFTLMKLAGEISGKNLDVPNYYGHIDFDSDMSKVASAIVVPSGFAAEYEKVAQKLAGEKQGEITKQIPALTADNDLSDDMAVAKSLKKANSISRSEKDIPDEALSALSGMPLHQILSSMAGLGMVAKQKEFKKIVDSKRKQGASKRDMSVAVMPEAVKTSAIKVLSQFIEERSALSPWIEKRSSTSPCSEPEELTGDINDMYVDYRGRLLNWDQQDTQSIMDKYANQISIPFGAEEEVFDLMVGMTKTAGLGSKSAITGLAASSLFAPYMASAHLKLKAAGEGKRLSGVKKVVADNPGKLGVTGALASATSLAKLLKKI